jgi:hypothetical protein
MALKRLGSTLAASLLLAAGIVDPVHAQGSSGMPMAQAEQMTQLDTEEIKNALREGVPCGSGSALGIHPSGDVGDAATQHIATNGE